jgi:hypothetical protein
MNYNLVPNHYGTFSSEVTILDGDTLSFEMFTDVEPINEQETPYNVNTISVSMLGKDAIIDSNKVLYNDESIKLYRSI